MDKQQRRLTAKRIRQLRDDLGWDQEELGKRTGVAKQTISGYETGRAGISRIADRIAHALGTTTDYLYGLTDNPLPPNEDEDDQPPAPLRTAILDELERLDEIDQQILYQMAMTLRLARERRSPRVIQ